MKSLLPPVNSRATSAACLLMRVAAAPAHAQDMVEVTATTGLRMTVRFFTG